MKPKVDILQFDHPYVGIANQNSFMWCLHCGRCYRFGEHREVVIGRAGGKHAILDMCPYPDCDGDTMFDAFPWWGKSDPERGVVYDQYKTY